jgi:hypothetical protein
MKTAKISAILVLIVCTTNLSNAAQMGTAWTYQGRLIDANKPADGLYDFKFKLFDANVAGALKGNMIDVNEVDVIDGYFTVELDFSSEVFNGDARWLQIAVRPGDSTDPNDFVTLSPRQEVTPMPYALQTRGIFVDDSGNVGIGTTSPVGKLHVATASTYGDVIFYNYGGGQDDLSIDLYSAYTGNTNRIYIVEVTDSEDDIDKFKWSDDNGGTWSSEIDMTTSWYDLSHGVRIKWDGTEGHFDKDRLIGDKWTWVAYHGNALVVTDGNVGIGTTNPSERLDVEGNIDVSSNQVKNYYGFPRPNYDSGWVSIAAHSFVTLTHNLGGNVDDYVVNMQFKGNLGIHCHGYGHDRYNTSAEVFRNGAYYRDLETDTIKVFRYANDLYIDQVRIRIWMYD